MKKKNTLLAFSILLAFILLSGGCKKALEPTVTEADEPKPTVTGLAITGPVSQKDPFTYVFTGQIGNYKEVIWSFGDGTTSYEKDVTHTYLAPGIYKVVLKAQNTLGYWAQQEGQVIIRPEDIVNFTAEAQPDGTLKLQAAMPAEIQTYAWYEGTLTTGLPISTAASLNIPMLSTVSFKQMTLKIKTTKGAEATYTKIVTNAGVLNDVTAQGASLTVSNENSSGPYSSEGSLKLIDGSNTTKFFIGGGYSSEFWAQQKLRTPVAVNAYVFVSGNDAKERDPKNWDLLGSNDGLTWVILDSRADIISDVRYETRVYSFSNSTAYSHYRVNIKAVRSGGAMQLEEWRLMSTL
ncbi:PKD repeat-containing protein [Pedobacter steynii]|uniref:PKD repeat-containing protein n=1 Tax=Pedobacter steynii TaxID=430522 RepID=A0A1G9UR23_9SPHI|nr:PKD domain-containing protein [Pedobacter steynii]NQX40849.1 PKD domain-containing protein [Pedobacter steynii]SDM62418.1 PKD repeat-containing protein [Pedobacter steynii]